MNAGLTRWQVEDILAASEEVDVPAGLMLRAAEDIRTAFLGPATMARPTSAVVSPIRVRQQPRRPSTRVAAVCAATLSVAALLGAANAGALPSAVQRPVATVAGLVGINLPEPDGNGPGIDAARPARPTSSEGNRASGGSTTRGTAGSNQTSGTKAEPSTSSVPNGKGGGIAAPNGNSGAAPAPNGNANGSGANNAGDNANGGENGANPNNGGNGGNATSGGNTNSGGNADNGGNNGIANGNENGTTGNGAQYGNGNANAGGPTLDSVPPLPDVVPTLPPAPENVP